MALEARFHGVHLLEGRLGLGTEVFDQIGDTADDFALIQFGPDLLELVAHFVPEPVELGGHWLGIGLCIHALLQIIHFFAKVVDVHPGEACRFLDTAHLVDRPKAQVFEAC